MTAASKIEVRSKSDAAKRWCPWLAAYSGARMGELTQLRAVDVVEQDGVHTMKISPEAGTTKTGKTRIVPLHEDLIAQGFLEFMKVNGKGPLFYTAGAVASDDPTNPKKPPLCESARTHRNMGSESKKLVIPSFPPIMRGGTHSRPSDSGLDV